MSNRKFHFILQNNIYKVAMVSTYRIFILDQVDQEEKCLHFAGLRQNVGISSLRKSFIPDLENPFRKMSERKNRQFSVILFLDTVYLSALEI